MSLIINKHIIVQGQVQGVGFRVFTLKAAERLSLKGKVRNLRDGRVEIVVLGATPTLAEFEKQLLKGPRLARVDSLQTKVIAEALQFERFFIDKDGDTLWYEI